MLIGIIPKLDVLYFMVKYNTPKQGIIPLNITRYNTTIIPRIIPTIPYIIHVIIISCKL